MGDRGIIPSRSNQNSQDLRRGFSFGQSKSQRPGRALIWARSGERAVGLMADLSLQCTRRRGRARRAGSPNMTRTVLLRSFNFKWAAKMSRRRHLNPEKFENLPLGPSILRLSVDLLEELFVNLLDVEGVLYSAADVVTNHELRQLAAINQDNAFAQKFRSLLRRN